MDETRALLDSLMGKDRNNLKPQKKASFTDPDVCKFYLLDFCPHDMFPNTKSDLGPCASLHSDGLKEAFEADANNEYYRALYEVDYMRVLKRLLDQVEQKIVKGQQRLNVPAPVNQETEKRVSVLSEEMSNLLQLAEEAGAQGKIEEAHVLSDRALKLRADIDSLKANSTEENQKDSLLRICQVCGAIQSVGDSASRFESHITGKQHVGFERIRAVLLTLKENEAKREAILRKNRNVRNSSASMEREKVSSKHSQKDGNLRDSSRERRSHERRDRDSSISPRRSTRNPSFSRRSKHSHSRHSRNASVERSLERYSSSKEHRKHSRYSYDVEEGRERNGHLRGRRYASRSRDRYERAHHYY